LVARKLTAADVVAAILEQNVQVVAGQVGQQPASPDQKIQISVRVTGRPADPEAFGRIILRTGEDGSLVLLKDIGRVELGAEDCSSTATYEGHDAIGLMVTQLPTANAIEIAKQVRETMAELSRSFPPGMKYAIGFDATTSVRESIEEEIVTLAETVAI